MGKAAKSKSRQSRREDTNGVGNLSPVGGFVDNNLISSSTPGIVVKLGSIDSKKRLGALVMLNDLLIQNATRSMALGKLTEPETLSALSVRLLDTSIEVVQQTILCLITISRMGKLYVEKLSSIGLDVTVVRLLSQSLSTIDTVLTGESETVQRTIPFLLLELVKVMFTNAPSFAKSKRDPIATMILQNNSKLVSHINVAEFVCELLSFTSVDSVGLCRQLYNGQLHESVKAALVVSQECSTADETANGGINAAALCLDTLLSAILLNLLSCSDSDVDEANAASLLGLLPRLINRISLRLPPPAAATASAATVASSPMAVDDAVTGPRSVRTLDDNKVGDHISHLSLYEPPPPLSFRSDDICNGMFVLFISPPAIPFLTLARHTVLLLSFSLSSPHRRRSQSSTRRSCRRICQVELLTPLWAATSSST